MSDAPPTDRRFARTYTPDEVEEIIRWSLRSTFNDLGNSLLHDDTNGKKVDGISVLSNLFSMRDALDKGTMISTQKFIGQLARKAMGKVDGRAPTLKEAREAYLSQKDEHRGRRQ
jgi:hypothetical protein